MSLIVYPKLKKLGQTLQETQTEIHICPWLDLEAGVILMLLAIIFYIEQCTWGIFFNTDAGSLL